jgi:hypothetical protein
MPQVLWNPEETLINGLENKFSILIICVCFRIAFPQDIYNFITNFTVMKIMFQICYQTGEMSWEINLMHQGVCSSLKYEIGVQIYKQSLGFEKLN